MQLEDPELLAAFQQYPTQFDGFLPLRSWLRQLTEHVQKPTRPDWDVLVTNSAVHSIELILRSFLDRGDAILVEEYTFAQVQHLQYGLLFCHQVGSM